MKRIGVLTSGAIRRDECGDPRRGARRKFLWHDRIRHSPRVQGHGGGRHRADGPRDVGGIINRGGTILRTARCKEFFEPEGRKRGAAALEAFGIEGIVTIGGDVPIAGRWRWKKSMA